MRRGIDSLVDGGNAVEILIVNDGSTDSTGLIADEYEDRYPGIVRAIHKVNGGHGSAVNVGIDQASGRHIKVVDSDDWVDASAYTQVLATLGRFASEGTELDVLLSNFVYEKVGKKRKRAVRYAGVLPQGRVFGWEDFGRFRSTQYILMHSLIYRTELLRDCGLRLPEHTFYVDNLYAFVPLPHVRTMFYLNVDFYRYFIGRDDQSVNEAVMVRRLDQQLRVNTLMQQSLPAAHTVPPELQRYMLHYFGIICAVSSVMLLRAGTAQNLAQKDALWASLRAEHPRIHRTVRRSPVGRITNLPSPGGRKASIAVYRVARWVVGFN